MEWKLARSALRKAQPQKKKRPGCSLPAGSFLFGAYRIIRRTPHQHGRDVFDEEVTIQGHRVPFMSVDLGERPAQIRARWMRCLASGVPAPSPERPAG